MGQRGGRERTEQLYTQFEIFPKQKEISALLWKQFLVCQGMIKWCHRSYQVRNHLAEAIQ